MSTTTYRTCPRSGLQFEAQAELLMKATMHRTRNVQIQAVRLRTSMRG